MQILEAFLKRQENAILDREFEKSIGVVVQKLAEVTSKREFASFRVIISGKGEVFSLGTSRYIVQVAEKLEIDLPRQLIDALNSPIPLGEKFKDLYAAGLGGEMKRYFIEEIVGETNTQELLDRPNQMLLYIDDHVNTGSKAKLILNGIQPHLAPLHSEIYFVAPVSGEAATGIKVNPKIIIGSENPDLFNHLKNSTLDWTT